MSIRTFEEWLRWRFKRDTEDPRVPRNLMMYKSMELLACNRPGMLHWVKDGHTVELALWRCGFGSSSTHAAAGLWGAYRKFTGALARGRKKGK